MIRILLADDQNLIRAGLRALLDSEPDIEVVGEATDGNSAVAQTAALLPDLVLMDIRMPVLDGIEATRRIAEDPVLAYVHVVILTTFELDEYIFRGLRAGASGFLVKDTDPAELLQAVRVVAAGESLLSPSVTRRLIAEYVDRSAEQQTETAPALGLLTEREREVVTLVAKGLSNTEIGERMVISPATAKTHVSRSMSKVGARDRAQLVVFAFESGLVRPGWKSVSPADRQPGKPAHEVPGTDAQLGGTDGQPKRGKTP
ncbi:response regulator [Amycolatopsis sp. cg13]|uniref:response regulator n=1 Tax=Amycolatopsis sp. cg13 TaxID=3238807 RepID=UPI0035243F32